MDERKLASSTLPMSVHSWGGLGSQIFAWLVADRVASERNTVLVHHTSGVTRRTLELRDVQSTFEMREIDDFYSAHPHSGARLSTTSRLRLAPRHFARLVLNSSGVITSGSAGRSLEPRLHPWTLAYRGHYTDSRLDARQVVRLDHALSVSTIPNFLTAGAHNSLITVHYRLGDLTTGVKGGAAFVSAPRLRHEILRVLELRADEIEGVMLVSDSWELASESLDLPRSVEVVQPENGAAAWDDLAALTQGAHLIGTNSKLSFWAAVALSYQGRPWSLPHELHPMVRRNSRLFGRASTSAGDFY